MKPNFRRHTLLFNRDKFLNISYQKYRLKLFTKLSSDTIASNSRMTAERVIIKFLLISFSHSGAITIFFYPRKLRDLVIISPVLASAINCATIFFVL